MNTKNFLSVILSLVMVITALPLTAVSSFAASSDFEYEILDDGTAVIFGYTGDATELVIPSEIGSKKVTSIEGSAFCDCSSLTSVTIPDSITSIGYGAFYNCTSLTSITISDSVTSIGNDAFYDTAYYNSPDNWEDGVLYIGHHLIDTDTEYDCDTETCTTTVPENYKIKSGTLTIAANAFSCCTSLTSITIPDSVTSIGGSAFTCCSSLESIKIPDSVTSIGNWAFSGCTSLTSITIPDSVTSIGSWAFYECTSLESIIIPDSVTSIEWDAFYDTSYYNNPDNWEDGVLYIGHHLIATDTEYDWDTDISTTTVPENYKIKNGTLTIAEKAFSYCTSLTSITIPDSVTSIGEDAFECCSSLVIYGYAGTEAERYANDNGFTFIDLDKESIDDPTPNPDAPTPNPNPDESTPDDPTPTPTPEAPADLNGDGKTTVVDAKWVLQSVANTRNLTDEQRAAADVNGDGKVTVVDAKWILQAVAGMRTL